MRKPQFTKTNVPDLVSLPARYLRRAAAQLLCGIAVAVSSFAAVAAPEMGVYQWDAPTGPANVDAFNQWLGKPAMLAEAFEASDRWDNVDGAGWQLAPWAQWVRAQHGRNLILSVPMLAGGWDLAGADGAAGTADDHSLKKCGAGQYDVYWANLANELAYYGLHWAYLRLGWEPDGGWYAWRAQQGQGNEANYASCFRRIVQVMRQTQPANQWKFVLNPTNAWWDKSYLDAIWPGNEYVDIVGIDLYDQSWAANTYPYPSTCDAACRLARQQNAWNQHAWYLATIRDFAIAHGKPMAIPEWGVAIRPDGHGGGDNPYFVQKMHEFVMNPNNYVAFHSYFNVSASDINARLTNSVTGDVPSGPTSFPESAKVFRQLFGAGSTPVPGPDPAPTVDNVAPKVSLTSVSLSTAADNRGTVGIEATASDNVAVAAVELFVNNRRVCRLEAAPYRCTYSSSSTTERSYTMTARAFDRAGNRAVSPRVYIHRD
jgi:hypothetical protein